MKRFVAQEFKVKAVFLDEQNAVEDAIVLGKGLVSANNGYLVARINGVDKTLGTTDVLFLAQDGTLHTMEKSLFCSLFSEYEIPTYSFGQAMDLIAGGKKVARKIWGEGVYLTLICPAVEMNPFVAIFDGVLKPYVPGSDTMLAEDFVEVE
ncbi:hypothetical protein SDC9_125573 [bioreactor metagenome]|uniref:Thoeris anti-defense 2-like domain-containing protein n=1 Tax=bioreactor metagenome TaxID=1076179 RepID=A0A645CP71_9ZZZZ